MSRYRELTQEATGAAFRPGNSFTILNNGSEIFPAMLDAMNAAKRSIEFVTYVYWRSDIATRFADALSDRARSGVSVRLLVDAVGGATMNTRTVWQLEQAGVKVAWFRPVRWPHLRRLNNRTHRKILLVDGKVGFTGGVGISDEWTGDAEDRSHWRETHCRIEGPACTDLFAGFAENWLEATGERLKPPSRIASAGDTEVHSAISTAGPVPTTMQKLFLAVIRGCEHRLWITTAYFVPNPSLMRELIMAVERGVDVRVLTNGSLSNHKVTRRAGHASYQPLLTGGVKIYEYQGTVLHSKVMSADSEWATIGSTNIDDRSMVLNDELNVSITDKGLVAALDRQFLADLKRSDEIRAVSWYQRGWYDRVAEAASSVFSRQL